MIIKKRRILMSVFIIVSCSISDKYIYSTFWSHDAKGKSYFININLISFFLFQCKVKFHRWATCSSPDVRI